MVHGVLQRCGCNSVSTSAICSPVPPVTSSRTSEHDDHMAFNSMGEFTVVVNLSLIHI